MKIYALCLQGYHERQEFQEKQALRYGLNLEIIPGVDGSLLSEATIQEAANYRSRPVTAKELGCFLSHKKAWELVVKRQETAIIIEDDIIFSSRILDVVKEISFRNSTANVIYDLEYVPKNHILAKKPKWMSSNNRMTATKIYQNKNGLGCYCLNSIAAEKLLLDCEKEVFNLADVFVWNRSWAEFLQIEPAPAIQMTYMPQYDILDAQNRQTRRDVSFTNKSTTKANLISAKKFFLGVKQSVVGRLLGVRRKVFCNIEEFKKVQD
tara:strand:- start:21 stop:818 length:798 start_codon:yes stop_codon:yes gene_type:complete